MPEPSRLSASLELRLSSLCAPRSHTCTVPLSLLTATLPPSARKQMPKILASSVPLRSSLTKLAVVVSQILTSVPLDEAVAKRLPEGVQDRAESGVV